MTTQPTPQTRHTPAFNRKQFPDNDSHDGRSSMANQESTIDVILASDGMQAAAGDGPDQLGGEVLLW